MSFAVHSSHQALSPPQTATPNKRMYLAVGTAMTGAIMFGLDQGNFGNVTSFKDFRELWCIGGGFGNEDTCSEEKAKDNTYWITVFVLWGASLITIGAALGGLILGPVLTDRLGRRPCISTGAGICFLGCVVVSFLSFGSVAIFMVGRFVTGFGVGVCCFALPMYNSEIAVPSVRGAMGSLFQFNVVVGSFIATIVTLAVQNWRLGMFLPGVAGLIVACAIWLTPESPRYVMDKRGYDAGLATLQQVRSSGAEIEAREIDANLQEERAAGEVSYAELFQDRNLRKRVLIACYLQIAQQLTGVNAFMGYATTIFGNCGFSDPLQVNLIWNCFFLVGCVSGIAIIDSPRGGRRKQLLGATVFMGPALVVASLSLFFRWSNGLTLAMVCIYGFFFQFAWGTIPWVYPSEIFAMAEREKAMSLAVFWQYAVNGIVYIITPPLMAWSIQGTFMVFGVLNVSNFFFVFVFIKETARVPLENIPALFGRRVGSFIAGSNARQA